MFLEPIFRQYPLSYRQIKSKIPFTAILSPRCASVRISSQSEMVSDVPPPPLDEVSMGSKAVTASKTTLAIDLIHKRKKYSLPIVSTRPVNIAAVDDRQGKYPRGVASALALRAVSASAFWRRFAGFPRSHLTGDILPIWAFVLSFIFGFRCALCIYKS